MARRRGGRRRRRGAGSGWVAQGPKVAEFEAGVRAALGAAHGVATTSLHDRAAPRAASRSGSARATRSSSPSLSFIATTNAPRYVGAHAGVRRRRPRDAEPDARDGRARASAPRPAPSSSSHQAGMPADVEAHRGRVRRRAASRSSRTPPAPSARPTSGRPVGGGAGSRRSPSIPARSSPRARAGCWSRETPTLAARLRRLREHGMAVSAASGTRRSTVMLEHYLELGFNYRMTDLQAAVGLVQLGQLDAMVARAPPARRAATATRSRTSPASSCPHDPPYGTTNHQSFCGAARGRPRRGARRGACSTCSTGASPRGAASWPPTSNRPARGAAAPRAAGDRAPDPPVAHPAAVPRDGRGRAGRVAEALGGGRRASPPPAGSASDADEREGHRRGRRPAARRTRPLLSIVMPAHNESGVIGRRR